MRKITLTPTEIEKVQDETGWTPFWFETNHGIVTIPGPPDDDEGWEDFYEEISDRLSCGCCECCGCDCWMDDVEGDYFYDDEEEEDE